MTAVRWRVGTVPYLVAKPLTAGLAEDPRIELLAAPPATLAKGLYDGSLDIALASSVLALADPPLEMWADGPVIAGDGAIRSVLLFLAPGVEGPEHIRNWFADPHSRTGRRLTQWLLRHAWNNAAANGQEVAPDQCAFAAAQAAGIDAVQLIGDPALEACRTHPEWTIIDLGLAWREATTLPFVYAGWMHPLGAELGELGPILQQAARQGLDLREDYVAEASQGDALRQAELHRYLFEDLRYQLAPGQVQAILGRLAQD